MKNIPSIFILSLISVGAFAATPEIDAQFFHPAASLYIQGESAAASNLVAKGLSIHPDDGKLKRLKELLEQQQEQENQENQQQQNQDQPQNEDQQNQDQENQQSQDQQQDEQNQNQEPQQTEPEPRSSEQMSEEEAKQLLDSMRQEEETKRMQLHPVLGAPVKVDKDW